MNRKVDLPNYMMPQKRFLFDPRVLDEIRKKAMGKPLKDAFDYITEELDRAYPGHIWKKQNWIFNNAGGAMGQLCLLHASIREYIIFFGSCIGTEGHSGRYASDVFDFMLKGTMVCEYEGVFEPEIHVPEGPPAFLASKVIKHYRIKDEAWMLEYSRGNILKMFPFGITDSFFSTLDIRTIARLCLQYGKLTTRGLFTKGKDLTAVLNFIIALGVLCVLIFFLLPLLP